MNADLATLADTDGAIGSDTITVDASDSLGGAAAQQQIAVTVNGTPVITAPVSAAVRAGIAGAISGVSLGESGDTSNETFTVTVGDTNGDLSASGSGVSGAGTTSLTITGSLTQVNSDLATLSDTDGAIGSDTITVDASDNLGGAAAQQQIAVTVSVAAVPVITAPASVVVAVGQTDTISGVSLAEGGSTGGESFTVTLADTNGDLSASGTRRLGRRDDQPDDHRFAGPK